eukprot:GEMP01006013.1.p1 GENE.GEMP01006013.1~~GEMP01006013.1.p1  ORF type:complete len:126 (+),score=17.49 GEMP01006013.1:285-662(+)
MSFPPAFTPPTTVPLSTAAHFGHMYQGAQNNDGIYHFAQIREALSDCQMQTSTPNGCAHNPTPISAQAYEHAKYLHSSPSPEPAIRRHSISGSSVPSDDPFEVNGYPCGPPSTFNSFGMPTVTQR